MSDTVHTKMQATAITDASLRLGKALVEWRDFGGSTTDVLFAIDDLVEARIAAHRSDDEVTK